MCAFIIGTYLAALSWDGVSFVSVSDWRSPAAVHGLRDLSFFRGASLSSAAGEYLLSQDQIKKTETGFDILLNQFVMRDENDRKNFVCQVEGRPGVFDRVEMRLIGEGISEAGKIPALIIEADCKSQPDPKVIGQIVVSIPMAEIYKLKPRDQQLRFYDGLNTRITISQMVSEWPLDWRLEHVRYFDSREPEQMLTLQAPKKEGSVDGAFTLSWPLEFKKSY